MPKFYITGGRETVDGTPRNDNDVPALVAYGKDRLEAVVNSGITVWSEDEWLGLQEVLKQHHDDLAQ